MPSQSLLLWLVTHDERDDAQRLFQSMSASPAFRKNSLTQHDGEKRVVYYSCDTHQKSINWNLAENAVTHAQATEISLDQHVVNSVGGGY